MLLRLCVHALCLVLLSAQSSSPAPASSSSSPSAPASPAPTPSAAASPSPASSPTPTASASWWNIPGYDCQGSDLGSSNQFGSVEACRDNCLANAACGGTVWVRNSTTLYSSCFLKNTAGPYTIGPNAICWCSLVLSRLSPYAQSLVVASMSASASPSATQTASFTATISPLPAPVWELPVDAATGLGGYVRGGARAPYFVEDRNGCPGGALSLDGGATLRTAAPVAGLPSGNAPRTLAAWVTCGYGGGAANTIVEYGSGGGAPDNNGRSGLYNWPPGQG
jgi:hypothetical protein